MSSWQRFVDRFGRTYYHNPSTDETSWDYPPSRNVRAAPSSSQTRSSTTSTDEGPRNPVPNEYAEQPQRPSSASNEGGAYTTITTTGGDDDAQQDLSSQIQQRLIIAAQGQARTQSPAVAQPGRGTPQSPQQTGVLSPPQPRPSPTNLPSGSTAGTGQIVSRRRPQAKNISAIPGGSSGASDLSPDYKVRDKPNKFFRLAKVFTTIYSENTVRPDDGRSEITKGYLGENIFSEIVWFVVIRENKGSCAALRILTYGGRGCGKNGVLKSDHARIYTSVEPPMPSDAERVLKRGEEPMQVAAFSVTPFTTGEKLDPMSRINLGKVYTIEHNVKVKGFGTVNNFQALYHLHKMIWDRDPPPNLALPVTREHPEESSMSSYKPSSQPRPIPARSAYSATGQSYGNTPHGSSYGTYMPVGSPPGKSPMTDAQARQFQPQFQASAQQQQEYLRTLQRQKQQQQQRQLQHLQQQQQQYSTREGFQYQQPSRTSMHQSVAQYQYAQTQPDGQQSHIPHGQQYPQEAQHDQTDDVEESSEEESSEEESSDEEHP